MTPYDEMTIDQLLREETKQYVGYKGDASLHITFVLSERRAARDAILDLAEQLDDEELVVVPSVEIHRLKMANRANERSVKYWLRAAETDAG